jgi:phosphonate transport system substrate-binding protein
MERIRLSRRAIVAGLPIGAAGLGLVGVARPWAVAARQATPAATPSTGPTPRLSFGIIPGEDAEVRRRQLQPLADYLEAELEVEDLQVNVGTDYTAVIEAMRADEVDLALFGPFSYILAHQVAGARALVVPGTDAGEPSTYRSQILANAEAGIADLDGLRGHSFSFVDPASTSGHLIPRSILVQNGIDPDRDLETIFAGGHDASLLSIDGGRVDAGAASEPQYLEMIEAGLIEEGNFVILAQSDPIPSSPYATRDDLDPGLRERLLQAMLRFHETATPEVAAEVLGANDRYVAADDASYDVIRETAEVLNLDLEALEE